VNQIVHHVLTGEQTQCDSQYLQEV
jgi:hypothetical protein